MNDKRAFSANFIRRIIDKDLETGKCISVHTRFPPEPNGYLHIGHAKSICLNFGIAKAYNGKCNLRFDDTNPEKENVEYIESIKYDIRWLGFNWSGDVCYSSNYFDQLYRYAVELISNGLAYVDELLPDQIRKYRGTKDSIGKNSPYRDRSIKENLMLFEKMRTGKVEENKACLRAKIDMTSPFMTMRDPVLYRIKFTRHHQTGKKWCIYPLYDFTHCISDALEGITHSLCTMEFQDNRRLYNWILDNITLPFRRPHQYEFSRLNLEYTITSKRKLDLLVTNRCVEGWDDPRMPTIAGFRRRGYTATTIRKFCESIGITRQDNTIEAGYLESCIREELNEIASRAMVVINPIKMIIENYPLEKSEIISIPNHPNKSEMGTREVPFGSSLWIDRSDFREKADKKYKRLVLGKKVRLRNAYIVKAVRIEKDSMGNIVTIYCTYYKNSMKNISYDKQIITGVIHWVSATYALPVEIRLYEYLFTVPKPWLVENILSVVNKKSLIIKNGYAEPSLKYAKKEKAYQFEREGYFCLDNRCTSPSNLVFNRTVSLRKRRKTYV